MVYQKLYCFSKHYLEKLDATKFLNIYATKKDKYFMPNDEKYKIFCRILFKKVSRDRSELDTFDKKRELHKITIFYHNHYFKMVMIV